VININKEEINSTPKLILNGIYLKIANLLSINVTLEGFRVNEVESCYYFLKSYR